MKKIDGMIFDLDGTLIRSGRDLAASVNYTLQALGLAGLPNEVIIGYVGDGVRKLIERSLGQDYGEFYEKALNIFRDHYSCHLLDTTDLYPGTKDMLEHFSSKRKAIITNKMQSFTLTIVEHLGISHYFDQVIGVDHLPYIKPDIRVMLPVLEKCDLVPERTVIVGDGVNDILLAKNAGAISCAHLNGLGKKETLLSLEPDVTYGHIFELKDLFC